MEILFTGLVTGTLCLAFLLFGYSVGRVDGYSAATKEHIGFLQRLRKEVENWGK